MRACLLVVSFLCLSVISYADSVMVPSEYATIQEAILAAVDGDRIVVQPGTYSESIVMKDGVDIVSITGPANTIIDGGGGGRTIDALAVAALLQGFTIRGGNSPTNGGGMRIGNGSDLRIDDCVIASNHAAGLGGGIAIQDSQARITYSSLTSNTAAGGAGIFVEGVDIESVILENCSIHENAASGTGGGVLIDNAELTISESSIYLNTAINQGGGVALNGAAIDLSFTSIFANTADEGGGISFHNTSTGVVDRATLYMNGATIGGAVSCTNNSFPSITQTILAGSTLGAAMSCRQGSAPLVSCSLLWGNAGGDVVCGSDGGDNLQADPQFCKAYPEEDGDFGIQSDSPAAPANSACLAAIGSGYVSCGTAPTVPATWGSIKLTYR